MSGNTERDPRAEPSASERWQCSSVPAAVHPRTEARGRWDGGASCHAPNGTGIMLFVVLLGVAHPGIHRPTPCP